MTLFLSVPDALNQLSQADEVVNAVRQPWTIPLMDVTEKSHGYRQEVNLRPGLNILIDDYMLHDDLVVETGSGKPCDPCLDVEISFMLSSHNRGENVATGCNFLAAAWCDSDGGQFHWQAGERVLKFDIHIESDLFATLVGEQFDTLPPSLKQLLRHSQPGHQSFRHTQPTTTAMQSVIHQILHCPYHGLTRWLYWEGKVLELIALRLDQVSQSGQSVSAVPGLQADDIDRIHYASSILLQRLENPPSLPDLSRLAGLNDYKLKQGFRRVFGTTVFGYLKTHRMEQAKHLLTQPDLSVAGVAQRVGYTSQSRFCDAFKQQFGMSPRDYRMTHRR